MTMTRTDLAAALREWDALAATSDPDFHRVLSKRAVAMDMIVAAARDVVTASVPAHPDPTGKTREPPHCPTCGCGLPQEPRIGDVVTVGPILGCPHIAHDGWTIAAVFNKPTYNVTHADGSSLIVEPGQFQVKTGASL